MNVENEMLKFEDLRGKRDEEIESQSQKMK